jgi:hypothetical protein
LKDSVRSPRYRRGLQESRVRPQNCDNKSIASNDIQVGGIALPRGLVSNISTPYNLDQHVPKHPFIPPPPNPNWTSSILRPPPPIKRSIREAKAEQSVPERLAEKPKRWLALLVKLYDYDRDEMGLFKVPRKEAEEGKSILAQLLDPSSEDEDDDEEEVEVFTGLNIGLKDLTGERREGPETRGPFLTIMRTVVSVFKEVWGAGS